MSLITSFVCGANRSTRRNSAAHRSCGRYLRAACVCFPGSVLHILRWQRRVNRTERRRAAKVGQLVAQYSANESGISGRLCGATCRKARSHRGRGQLLVFDTALVPRGCVFCSYGWIFRLFLMKRFPCGEWYGLEGGSWPLQHVHLLYIYTETPKMDAEQGPQVGSGNVKRAR